MPDNVSVLTAKATDGGHSYPRLSIVVPALNEAHNLPYVLAALPADIFELILVDGHSVDQTVVLATSVRPDLRVMYQNRRGKGNALACGFAAATGDIIVMLDADGSADPREIPRFVQTLLEGADFAKGSRFMNGGGSNDITRLRFYGNRALNGIVNLAFRAQYSDLCYGYNAFWRRCLPAFSLDPEPRDGAPPASRRWGDGFEIETVLNLRAARGGLRVVEVPSFEGPRLSGVSNLNAFSDGLRVLRTIGAEWWRRPRPVSPELALPDVVIDLVQRAATPAAEVAESG